MNDQSSEVGRTRNQLVTDGAGMPAEAARGRGLVGRLRARPKLTVALLVATLMATVLVGVYISRNNWKNYDSTPSGVVEHAIDTSLAVKREENPDPLTRLICNPNTARFGVLKWNLLKNIDPTKRVSPRFKTDRWSVTETGSRARVTVEISVLFDRNPQYNVTQLWEFDLEHTDRWRVCSSSQIS